MQSRDDFRAAFADLLERLTLGPLQHCEKIDSAPSDTYLTGILWPRGSVADPEDDDSMAPGEGADPEADGAVPGYRAIKPCSIGVTFSVGIDMDVVVSLGTTARYVPKEADAVPAPEGEGDTGSRRKRPAIAWHHQTLGYRLELRGGGPAASWSCQDFTDESGRKVTDNGVTVHLKRRVEGETATWTATLINSSHETEDPGLRDSSCLFQSQLVIEVSGDASDCLIRPRRRARSASTDSDTLTGRLIYRSAVEYAVGHGIAIDWNDGPATGVSSVRTSWLPRHSVSGTCPGVSCA